MINKNSKAPLAILTGAFILSTTLLSGCTTTPRSDSLDYNNMTCEELSVEIESARNQIETGSNSNSEVNRTVDTGATVAVQGAAIAGVPYIGAVFSIGKTLMNHSKQTSKQRTAQASQDLYNLENIAYEKGCMNDYL